MRVPLSKYDYGRLNGGGPDWYGSASIMYQGPPHSFWYNMFPYAVLLLKGALLGGLAMVTYG